MKKATRNQTDVDMLEKYDFSEGVRGKYAQRFAEGSNVVVLAPDAAAAFPDSHSVNEARRLLIEIAGRSSNSYSVLKRCTHREEPPSIIQDLPHIPCRYYCHQGGGHHQRQLIAVGIANDAIAVQKKD